jgi:hypothetical protein
MGSRARIREAADQLARNLINKLRRDPTTSFWFPRDHQPRTRSTGDSTRRQLTSSVLPPKDAVEDFGNDLCSLGDGHSGTIEEEITVRKRNLAVTYGLKVSPPRMPF